MDLITLKLSVDCLISLFAVVNIILKGNQLAKISSIIKIHSTSFIAIICKSSPQSPRNFWSAQVYNKII